jgi:hypothetical protein
MGSPARSPAPTGIMGGSGIKLQVQKNHPGAIDSPVDSIASTGGRAEPGHETG